MESDKSIVDSRETGLSNDDETTLEDREHSYPHYAAAVRYGIALATLERYSNKTWAEIEPDARREWEEKNERPWEEFETLVREAWEETKSESRDQLKEVKDINPYETAFRDHFQNVYAHNRGYTYRRCAPAYHFGYDLAVDEQLANKAWEEIEPSARRQWEEQGYAGTWEEFQEAARYAWKMARAQT
jgi:hypothetical protein